MKAISLWEPWASLISTGAKKWETRSWATSYRGPLLICAAKGGLSKKDLADALCCWDFQGGLGPLVGQPLDLTGSTWPGVEIEHLQFGNAVAIVELSDCIPTGPMTFDFLETDIGMDRRFGDFSRGRLAWKLENLQRIDPFPVKGKQGLFEVEYEGKAT